MARHSIVWAMVIGMWPLQAHAADVVLWYDHPAHDWMTEALPIGNGRLGAMLFGGRRRNASNSTRKASGSATRRIPGRIRRSAM